MSFWNSDFISLLPDELALKIFSHLEMDELLMASQVSKDWRRLFLRFPNSLAHPSHSSIAVDDILWKKFFLERYAKRTRLDTDRSWHDVEIKQHFKSVEGAHEVNYRVLVSKLSPISDMLVPRIMFGVAELDGGFFIVGGCDGSGVIQNSVEYFGDGINKWKLIPPLKERRAGLACVTAKGRIYAAGGLSGDHKVLNSVECFDKHKSYWKQSSPMLAPRMKHSCEVIEDNIYTCGGNDGEMILRSIERYSLREKRWKYFSDMLNPREGLSCCRYRDFLVIVGGRDKHTFVDSIEVVNLSSKHMSTAKCPGLSHYGGTCCVIGEYLYIFCGFDGLESLSSIRRLKLDGMLDEMLDEMKEEGRSLELDELPPLQLGRYYLGSSSSNGKIFLFGGYGEGKVHKSVEKMTFNSLLLGYKL